MPSLQHVNSSKVLFTEQTITELLAEKQPQPSGTSEGRGAGSLASATLGLPACRPVVTRTRAS